MKVWNYNIFSNKVINLSHYHIYHEAKAVFTKTFLRAAVVWALSTNSVSERRWHGYEDCFFSRVPLLISTERLVSVVLKAGDQSGP